MRFTEVKSGGVYRETKSDLVYIISNSFNTYPNTFNWLCTKPFMPNIDMAGATSYPISAEETLDILNGSVGGDYEYLGQFSDCFRSV